jgi:hypothetical protein
LVVCPHCGNSIQKRKIVFLTNLNSITCQVCGYRLRVKNKGVSSVIGGFGGGIGGFVAIVLLSSWFRTNNVIYLAMLVVEFIALFVVLGLLMVKYTKLELVNPPPPPLPTT